MTSKVVDILREGDRIIAVKLILEKKVQNLISVYSGMLNK